MADAGKKFIPTDEFGMKGLESFRDAQFIDDQALAMCLNVTLDTGVLAVRAGSNLLYDAPIGETGSPEQLFHFTEGQGQEFLLAKFTENWYLLDPTTDLWLKIGSQNRSDPLYDGATWHNSFYSNDMYSQGYGNNIAFFAASDYSVPDNDTDTTLMWRAGITHLTADAHIGDTTISVENSNALTFNNSGFSLFSLGGDPINGIKGNTYQLQGTLTDGSDIVTGLSTTGAIKEGVPVSGNGIPQGTTVLAVIDSTSIQLSNPASTTTGNSFDGIGDLSATSADVANFFSQVQGNGDLVEGDTQITGFTITGTAGASVAAGMTITGTGIPDGTFIVDFTFDGSEYMFDISNAATASGSKALILINVLANGDIVTGAGIPSNTTVDGLTGSPPAYTAFTLSNAATASITSANLNFLQANPPVTLTFTESNIIILQISPLTANYPSGTPVAGRITTAPTVPNGNTVLVWLAKLVVSADTGFVLFSVAGNPLDFTEAGSGVSGGIQGYITDMRAFGQFFIASSRNTSQIGQLIADSNTFATSILFTPYLAGDGLGPISSAGTILYNNEYYYPSATNGIMKLSPNFTGTSSAAGVAVLTDSIQDLFRLMTFLRGAAFNRKLYWLVSIAGTPEVNTQNYYLVYDFISNAFTITQHPSVDITTYIGNLCLFGTDGAIYQGEYNSFEDYIGGKSVGYVAEAYSKRYDFSEPSLPKDADYCMIQGDMTLGTTLFVDVLYNEGGSLGKTTYQIKASLANEYFTLPGWDTLATSPLAMEVLAGGDPAAGKYRVYIELNKNYKAHNYQLHFYTQKAGSYWTVNVVSPHVEVSGIPRTLVISPIT